MPAVRTFASSKRSSDATSVLHILTAALIIAALYFGKELFIPFALALLLSFLLTTPVNWLERLRLGRGPAVVFVLAVTVCIIGLLLWLGAQQLTGIVASLPQYQDNIRRKLEAVRNPAGPGLLGAAETIKQLETELGANTLRAGKPPEQIAAAQSHNRRIPGAAPLPAAPVPVEIVHHDSGVLESLGLVSASVGHLAITAAAVLVLTLFMLIKRGHLRNRLFGLFGQGHLVLMTTALDDAATRVSRYLLTQLLVNTVYGALLGLCLYLIGVPYAPFWGVITILLRFIPYVGTFVAGLCPFILALAVFEGWKRPLLTLGSFAVIEILASSVIEPWLYATRTGISSLAILLSATFWTLLWGPIGLVLATPLTVCLVVLGRHVQPFEFLYVLLGDDPVLTPETRYYQRLVAFDDDEAADLIETELKDKSVTEVYDSVIIPALSLAEQDRHENRLDSDRAAFVVQSTQELIEDLPDRRSSRAESDEPAAAVTPLSILCLPARDEADALVGMMLCQLARAAGHRAELLDIGDAPAVAARLKSAQVDVVFVSALPPFAVIHARTICRRVRHLAPDLKITLGLWNSVLPAEKIAERLGQSSCDSIVTSLAQAEEAMRQFTAPVTTELTPAPEPALEPVT